MLSPFPPFTVKIPKNFSEAFPSFTKIAAPLLNTSFLVLNTPPGVIDCLCRGGYLSGRGDTPPAVCQVVLGYTQKCIKIKFQKHLSA